MNVDQLIRHLAQCRRRIRTLTDKVQRLEESRAPLLAENKYLRKQNRRLERSRDLWRARAPKRWTRSSVPPIELRPGDLERILEMPARD